MNAISMPLRQSAGGVAPSERRFTEAPSTAAALALLDELAAQPPAQAPAPVEAPVVLYGAGALGQMARDYLARIHHPVAAVVDRNAAALRDDPRWQGTEVLTLAQATALNALPIAITVSTAPQVPMWHALAAAGWRQIAPFYDVVEAWRDRHPLSNGWFSGTLDATDHAALHTTLAHWHDDISRAHHLQCIAWRALRAEWSFDPAPVCRDDRFSITELRKVLRDRERLLDVGAHHGEVACQLAQAVPGAIAEVWAIEPDDSHQLALRRALQRTFDAPTRPVHIITAAASDRCGQAPFFGGAGYASQLSALGTECVPTVTIDALNVDPSIVKLHLEGHELAALDGARATLTRARPIVLVTAYHSRDGLWRLPRWFAQHLPDYRLLFRAHGWCGTGAVIYALPPERFS